MHTQEELLLKAAIGDFLKAQSGPDAVRAGRALVREMADMGFTGTLIDERYQGCGLGITAACIIAEQVGRHLTLTPLISAALLPSYAITRFGTALQHERWLPGLASGAGLIAIHHGGKGGVSASGAASDDLRLTGRVEFIPDLSRATALLLSAGLAGEPLFCLVPLNEPGVVFECYRTLDGREFADVELTDVRLPGEHIVSPSDASAVESLGALLYAAEQLGSARAAFDLASENLKSRKQFGRLIGSFQALQHRAAMLYTALATLEALVLKAARALQDEAPEAPCLCSMAKAKAGRTGAEVANEAIQFHGGAGMTDEYDVGLYLKRIAVSERLFGDSHYHTDRVAAQHGF